MKHLIVIFLLSALAVTGYGQQVFPHGSTTSVDVNRGLSVSAAFRFPKSAPASFPQADSVGLSYYDPSDGSLYVYDGSTWNKIGGGGSGGTPGLPDWGIQTGVNGIFRGSSKFLYKRDTLFDAGVNRFTDNTIFYDSIGFFGAPAAPQQTGDIHNGLKNLGLVLSGTLDFNYITHTPDDLAGYGITDAYTTTETDNAITDATDYMQGNLDDSAANIRAAFPSTAGLATTAALVDTAAAHLALIVGKQAQLNGTGLVRMAGTSVTYDNVSYYPFSNPSSFIPLTALSSTATGLSYSNITGIFSLTAGYSIPTNAQIANWNTAFSNMISSLTTTGSSGAATLSAGVLNIPTPTIAGLGGVPTSLSLTINGSTQDLSTNRTWSVGTVTTFSSGSLSPLFTANVATTTTTPALTFSLSNAAAHTFFGNFTGSTGAPSYGSPVLASADFANQGTTTTLLHGNASGNPSWGQIVNADIVAATIDVTTKITGVTPVANGGTNASSYTTGSVLYFDGTRLTQNNSNFYFASGLLSVGTNGDFTGTNNINTYGQIDAYQPNSAVGTVNSATIPGITASTSRGTGTSPTINSTGDLIGNHSFWAYTGSSPAYTNMAGVVGTAVGATSTNLGGQLDFYTKADNASTYTSKMTVKNDGHLVMEGVTTTGATGTGNMVFSSGPTLTNPVVGTQTAGDNSSKGASTGYVDGTYAIQYTTTTNVTTAVTINSAVASRNAGVMYDISAQAGALLFAAPTGSWANGQWLEVIIASGSSAYALTYNSIFTSGDNIPATTTTANKTTRMLWQYNSNISKFQCVYSAICSN